MPMKIKTRGREGVPMDITVMQGQAAERGVPPTGRQATVKRDCQLGREEKAKKGVWVAKKEEDVCWSCGSTDHLRVSALRTRERIHGQEAF